MDTRIRRGEPGVRLDDGGLTQHLEHPPALRVGLGVELGSDQQLGADEDAQGQVLPPVLDQPGPGGAVLATSTLTDRIDEEGRVQMDHQPGSRTGWSPRLAMTLPIRSIVPSETSAASRVASRS